VDVDGGDENDWFAAGAFAGVLPGEFFGYLTVGLGDGEFKLSGSSGADVDPEAAA